MHRQLPRSARAPLIATGLVCAAAAVFVFLLAQPFVWPVASTPPAVDPARLHGHVKTLSVDLFPRSFDQDHKLQAAARYIEQAFRAAGAAVALQPVVVDGVAYRNVIARFGPAQGPLLVVGAHYDSHGLQSPGALAATHTPGADDNASGVAGLIELARLLGATRQARPIELVAYTLEEPPHFRSRHMGSVWHAEALRKAGREVRLMLSLEMIGYFSDAPGSQSYPVPGMAALYSDRGDFIALVGRFAHFGATRRAKALMAGAGELPVYSLNGPALIQGIDFSDHRSYWAAGYPALMVTDTAFQRNPHYHRPQDTHEKLDYVRMARVVQAVHSLLQAF